MTRCSPRGWMLEWQRVKEAGANTMLWWELLVKPGIKSLLIERGKEMNNERSGQLKDSTGLPKQEGPVGSYKQPHRAPTCQGFN